MKKKLQNLLLTFILLQTFTLSSQAIDPSLYVFDFELDHLPLSERVTYLKEQGFAGLTMPIRSAVHLEKLKAYLNTDEVKSGAFSVPIVFMAYDFKFKEKLDLLWKEALAISPGMPLWVIFKSDENFTQEHIKGVLEEMTAEAAKFGSDIVIYPHDRTMIEGVEQALPLVQQLNKNNLKLTLHLCHELRAGNGNRLLDIAIAASPYLTHASISGSNISVIDNSTDWSDTIKPLDEGDYDVEKFVSVLQKIKFKGKTVLHTFGIKDNENHLVRSMEKWNDMVKNTHEQLNTDLSMILDSPENAYWDFDSESWFISSLGGEKVTIAEDAYGWLTRLDKDRNVIASRWVEGLDAPTGMASYKGHLYVADRGVLVKINIEKGEIIEKIKLTGSRFPNDVAAADNGDIYISDTYENIIYKLDLKGKLEVFLQSDQLECPNGLWVDGNNLIVASWGPMSNEATFETSKKGTVLKVNRKTKVIQPIGEGKPIANFDGIVKYENYYLATDWTGGRLLKISKSGEVTEILTGFIQLADLGIDEKNGIIMMPEMSKNRFIILNTKGL